VLPKIRLGTTDVGFGVAALALAQERLGIRHGDSDRQARTAPGTAHNDVSGVWFSIDVTDLRLLSASFVLENELQQTIGRREGRVGSHRSTSSHRGRCRCTQDVGSRELRRHDDRFDPRRRDARFGTERLKPVLGEFDRLPAAVMWIRMSSAIQVASRPREGTIPPVRLNIDLASAHFADIGHKKEE
jgi:hypothetical protein